MQKWLIITIISVIIVFGGIIFLSRSSNPTGEVNGLQCSRMEGSVFHIHPHLKIVINGEQQFVPANIGITQTCMYWTHTHDSSGIIHVESPVQKDILLGDFLGVWRKIRGSTPFDGKTVTNVTVDGQTYSGDYNSILFHDKQEIVILIDSKK